MNDNPALKLQGVSRSFGPVEVFRNLSLEDPTGEFVAVVGPSGSGKTTLLNLISGFDAPSAGTVARSGRLRMVYQHGGLFPWLTAAQNIAMGLRDVADPTDRDRQLGEMLQLVGLEGIREITSRTSCREG